MKDGKASRLAVIMGMGPKHDDDGSDMHDGADGADGHEDGMMAAADEMFDALKAGNKERFRMALDSYCDLHGSKPKEDEPSKDDLEGEDDGEDDGEDGDGKDGYKGLLG